jgi:hypothetical protein
MIYIESFAYPVLVVIFAYVVCHYVAYRLILWQHRVYVTELRAAHVTSWRVIRVPLVALSMMIAPLMIIIALGLVNQLRTLGVLVDPALSPDFGLGGAEALLLQMAAFVLLFMVGGTAMLCIACILMAGDIEVREVPTAVSYELPAPVVVTPEERRLLIRLVQ